MHAEQSPTRAPLPLAGIRVIDMATVIAAPFCATVLGEFGADVMKVEPSTPTAATRCAASARRRSGAIR